MTISESQAYFTNGLAVISAQFVSSVGTGALSIDISVSELSMNEADIGTFLQELVDALDVGSLSTTGATWNCGMRKLITPNV